MLFRSPGRAFGQMMGADDAFTTWFVAQVKAVHGVDLTIPSDASPSELVVDSGPVAALAG